MSYRSFKHLLGETSLERKCRFIFGLGIFLLVTVSFLLYGLKTEALVKKQTTQTALMLVNPTLMNIHYKKLGNENFESIIDVLWGGLRPLDDMPNSEPWVLNPYNRDPTKKQPEDDFEKSALVKFLEAASNENAIQKAGKPQEKPYYFADGTPMWADRINKPKKEYQYIQAVTFKSSCLMDCHSKDKDGAGQAGQDDNTEHLDNHLMRPSGDGQHWVPTKAGDLAGAVVVHVPMKATENAINSNRAMLITAALVTAILAMVSSYMIVRYVIVKPVKHLRDVSDAIAAGRLNIRSQIQTGDEFEDLSHAFNRMLHNLVAMQQELRDVNGDLDKKVDELAQANMALYEMNRIKSDFLATMSHELRTPLNSIIGFSEVLSGSDSLGERQRRVCQQHPDLRQDAAGNDQRYSRPGQDRERQDGGPNRGLLDSRRLRSGRQPDAADGRSQEHHAGVPARGSDSLAAARPWQGPPDSLQSDFQCHQVHARRGSRDAASPNRWA